MKVELHYSSASRVGWSATLVVDGRGSASCHWHSVAGEIERSTPHHDFDFSAAAFEQVFNALSVVPASGGDGLPQRRIVCSGTETLERARAVTGQPPSASEAQFDRVWFELFIRVRPALLDIGMPEELLDEAS